MPKGPSGPVKGVGRAAGKSFASEAVFATVPQTDTGGRGEQPQALE